MHTRNIQAAVAASAVIVATSLTGGAAMAAGQGMEVTIDGQRLAPQEVIGKPVETADGQRIGKVVDLIGRKNTYNDVVVKLQPENRQMGLVLGREDARLEEKAAPVVLGGSTVALRAQALDTAADGKALTVAEATLTTLSDDAIRWSEEGGSAN